MDCFSTFGIRETKPTTSKSPLGLLFPLTCPGIKVSENWQSKPGRTINDSDLSGMKVQVTPPRKEPQPTEVLAKGLYQ